MVTCSCTNCNGHIAFDASTFKPGETHKAECPHCKMETTLFIPPTQEPPATAKPIIDHQRCPQLVVISLAIGMIACVLCWHSLLGLYTVPLAALTGLLLAICGGVMLGSGNKVGVVFAVSGAVVCHICVICYLISANYYSYAISRGKKPIRYPMRQMWMLQRLNGPPQKVSDRET